MSISSRLFKKKKHTFFGKKKITPKIRKKKSPGIIKDNNPYIHSFDLTESLVFFIYREWQKKSSIIGIGIYIRVMLVVCSELNQSIPVQ